MSADDLAGYLLVEVGQARGLVLAAAARWLEESLAARGSVREWAHGASTAELSGGRAAVRVVPAVVEGPDGRARWACREYRRGGLAARLLGDRYVRWGRRRPFLEARASRLARSRGVPTPAVIAAVAYEGGAFYRGDIVTEVVPNVLPLADVLFGTSTATARDAALLEAGHLVRVLEVAGLLHADLNAHNVLVPASGRGGDAWVVDLDRCRDLGARARAPTSMRRRLERSLLKLGERHGRPLGAPEWQTLRTGYESGR